MLRTREYGTRLYGLTGTRLPLSSFVVASIWARNCGWSCQNFAYGSRLWLVNRTQACTSHPDFLPCATATSSGSYFFVRSMYGLQPTELPDALHQRFSSSSLHIGAASLTASELSR